MPDRVLATFGGLIIQDAGVDAAFLAAGGISLAGAAFGALRFAFHRSVQLSEGS